MMYIERIQVEEGFLDGLDISMTPGLNVVIGARGTGKTSLIELVRFCLGAPGHTADSPKRSHEHAKAVLGGGQVSVTLVDGARRVTVSRSAGDSSPRASGPYLAPIVFSQTEIENVGLQALGRLRLVDGFVSGRRDSDSDEISAVAEVKSICADINRLRQEVEDLDRQLVELPSINAQINELAPHELRLSSVSTETAERKRALDAVSEKISNSAVLQGHANRTLESIDRWQSRLASAVEAGPHADLTSFGEHEEKFKPVFESISKIQVHLAKCMDALGVIRTSVDEISINASHAKLEDEAIARNLRKEIESLQSGAGSIASAGQQLREKKAQLEALSAIADARRKEIQAFAARRMAAQDRLDAVRQQRYADRREVVDELNATLGPRIKIEVGRGGQFEIYAGEISDALRGSGLRYNEISQQIATKVGPAELVELAESADASTLSRITGIANDRCARVLFQLRTGDLGSLATVLVDDLVRLQLLDGNGYKDINDLSTGQRCTVVLPIILRHSERVLIVDQPEDHIDNAFITDTLIKSLLAREGGGQIIFSTHNANIPVLGNADNVIELSSDGRRGFVVVAAPLQDPRVVHAISTIMEGGMLAFSRRASFYGKEAQQP